MKKDRTRWETILEFALVPQLETGFRGFSEVLLHAGKTQCFPQSQAFGSLIFDRWSIGSGQPPRWFLCTRVSRHRGVNCALSDRDAWSSRGAWLRLSYKLHQCTKRRSCHQRHRCLFFPLGWRVFVSNRTTQRICVQMLCHRRHQRTIQSTYTTSYTY